MARDISDAHFASYHIVLAGLPEVLEPSFVAEFLHHLSSVPRFEMTVMSIPPRDRAVLKSHWDSFANVYLSAKVGEVASLESLRKKFRLA